MPERLPWIPDEEQAIRRDIAAIGDTHPALAQDLDKTVDLLAEFIVKIRDLQSVPISPEDRPKLAEIVASLTEAKAVLASISTMPDPP